MAADELHFAETDDGWKIALSRYRAKGAARARPVLLCHGLATNREAFDASPDVSLTAHLTARGWDVWALELRGYGRSRPRPAGRKAWDWDFDDFLLHDLPAALALLRDKSGAADCHVIGHSMGGNLLLAHLARGGAGVRSGVTLGSTLDYSRSSSEFHRLLKITFLTQLLPAIPFGPLARLGSPFAFRFDNPIDAFSAHRTNVDAALLRRLQASGMESASSRVLQQLATAFKPGGLRSRDGMARYFEGLPRVKTPLLFLAGDADRQCPPEAAQVSFEAAGSPIKDFITLGPANGNADHYGHMDLILGRRVAAEVYPKIEGWLAYRDAAGL